MPNYIFHVGLPKTATTSLQNIFASLSTPLLIYNPLGIDRQIQQFFYHYIYQGTFASSNEVLEHHGWKIDHTIARINKTYRDKSVLISTESLSYAPNRLCYRESAEFLLRYFGDHSIKIVLVLRHQLDWMLSYYNHMVTHHCLTTSFSDFYQHGVVVDPSVASCDLQGYLFDQFAKLGEWRFSLESLDYVDIVNTFENNFGKDNVLVYTFEELVRDNNQFIKRVGQLMGDANFLLKNEKLPYKRPAEHVLTIKMMRFYFMLLKFAGICITSSAKSRCELDRFAESQSFSKAIKVLPIYDYPKLVCSRLYRKRLMFCNADSVREICRRITRYLPYVKSIHSDEERKHYSGYWREQNSFLGCYIDDPEVRNIYLEEVDETG